MRIAFDATSMPARRAGAGTLMFQLGRALAAHGRDHPILLLDRFGAYEALATQPGVTARRVRAGNRVLRFGWEQAMLPGLVSGWGADVLHGAHHALPLRPAASAAVTTVHDVTFDILPRRYTFARRWYMRLITRLGLHRADRVIVSSSWVRDALVRRYAVPLNQIAVVPLAPAPEMTRIEDSTRLNAVRARYALPAHFLLSVGTREPGKNRGILTEALSLLDQRGMRAPLVIAGQRGWLEDSDADERHAGHIQYLGYVADVDMPALYTLADALLFPSLLEGFGVPPLEALACGTPVIASDRPAMPEVLGDAALYADPRSAMAWADAIERLSTERDLSDALRARGRVRAARYSWERAARETIEVYRAALNSAWR